MFRFYYKLNYNILYNAVHLFLVPLSVSLKKTEWTAMSVYCGSHEGPLKRYDIPWFSAQTMGREFLKCIVWMQAFIYSARSSGNLREKDALWAQALDRETYFIRNRSSNCQMHWAFSTRRNAFIYFLI